MNQVTTTAPELTPLRLADGRLVCPHSGNVYRDTPPDIVDLKQADDVVLQSAIMRRLEDLPLVREKMHGVAVIFAYKMFGLSIPDISVATSLPIHRIEQVLESEAYVKLQDCIVSNIRQIDENEIRAKIHRNARIAAQEQATLLIEGSESARVAMIKDVLDRDGFRPADVVEHRLKMEGGLRVEIVKKTENVDVPIDVTFKELESLDVETTQ